MKTRHIKTLNKSSPLFGSYAVFSELLLQTNYFNILSNDSQFSTRRFLNLFLHIGKNQAVGKQLVKLPDDKWMFKHMELFKNMHTDLNPHKKQQQRPPKIWHFTNIFLKVLFKFICISFVVFSEFVKLWYI